MRVKTVYILFILACAAGVIALGFDRIEDGKIGILAQIIVIAAVLALLAYGLHQLLYVVSTDKEGVVVRAFRKRVIPWGALAGWSDLPEAAPHQSAALVDHRGRTVLVISRHLHEHEDGLRMVRLVLPKLEPAHYPLWRDRAALWNAGAANVALWLAGAWWFGAGWQWCWLLCAAAIATLLGGVALMKASGGHVGLLRGWRRVSLWPGFVLLGLTLLPQPLWSYSYLKGGLVGCSWLIGLFAALLGATLLKSMHWRPFGGVASLVLTGVLGGVLFANLNTTLWVPDPVADVGQASGVQPSGLFARRVYADLTENTSISPAALPQKGDRVLRWRGESLFGFRWVRQELGPPADSAP
ncbi:MAG: hypothetical protein H6840_04440 [Planctomycetes bacterium]|nr:hypothetical protein [Planctomycetota bacterium]